MARFIEEVDRGQQSLLPGSLDDWVHKDNSVRVIDAFVEALDLRELGFETAEPIGIGIGRPGFHPVPGLSTRGAFRTRGHCRRSWSISMVERQIGIRPNRRRACLHCAFAQRLSKDG